MNEPDPRPIARQYSVSLFPEHDTIVRQYASDSHRTYSNALQFIIEDWARLKTAAVLAAQPAHD